MANPEQTHSLSTQAGPGEERTQRLSDRVEKATEQVAESALAEVQHVRERAESGLERGRDQLGERIRRVSSALRTAGEDLRREDESVARYAAMASDRVERVASYVSTADLRSVARDVERFAREQPVPFFGGAFLLGLTVGRFLKSSASPQMEANEWNESASPRESGRPGSSSREHDTNAPSTSMPMPTPTPTPTPSRQAMQSMPPPSSVPYGGPARPNASASGTSGLTGSSPEEGIGGPGGSVAQGGSIQPGSAGSDNQPSAPGSAGMNQGPRRTPGNP